MKRTHGPDAEPGAIGPLKGLSGGDLAAFEEFCIQIEGPLYTYVLRQVHNRAEAEDIAQEALLRLFRMARNGRLRPSAGTPRALLFSIAHNLAVDYHRKARPGATQVPASCEPPSRNAERGLLRDQIDRALAELPESHRSAVLLREFGELSYAEIGKTLNATGSQVKTWIYRARKQLAQLLDRDGQYIGETAGDEKNGR